MKILDTLQNSFGKTRLTIKQHSPEILIIAGAAGVVASTVLACRATLKASEIKAQLDRDLTDIADARDAAEDNTEIVYREEDAERDRKVAYAHAVVGYVKLYAPAVTIGLLSLGTIFASNNILRKRNASLVAAYTAVDTAFKKYRKNVVDTYGSEIDYKLRHSLSTEKVDSIEVDPETGKEKKTKKTVNVLNDTCDIDYSRIFDSSCVEWEDNADYNYTFLKAIENHMNNILRTRGYVFLNEVYRAIGFPDSEAGQVVGWIYDKNNGDCHISLGIDNITTEARRRFKDGLESVIIVDPNVDGVILGKINQFN